MVENRWRINSSFHLSFWFKRIFSYTISMLFHDFIKQWMHIVFPCLKCFRGVYSLRAISRKPRPTLLNQRFDCLISILLLKSPSFTEFVPANRISIRQIAVEIFNFYYEVLFFGYHTPIH
jgi:hypothetical protein